jgi:methylmalonyl-CoA mutase C-terminal domain/subunit
MTQRLPIRVVVAKPGLDGHDRGAQVVARALRDAGMEVIYTGIRQTPEMIVAIAIQEDADCIGLSLLSGSHIAYSQAVIDLLRQRGIADIAIIVGGIIPEEDVETLLMAGVGAVFGPGSSLVRIVGKVTDLVSAKRRATDPAGHAAFGGLTPKTPVT